ncbi:hypothetical protein C8J55DRAFT_493222 [Lentinula edodes]|uniref:Uncharacterized protein n=1 Tax=Lentinula lateritia TaxID=40482 RepID=A0A9W9DE52_9AGAR|nr:hypothetical protein C8J55DRAFT_493222 [Lentinula edodes]
MEVHTTKLMDPSQTEEMENYDDQEETPEQGKARHDVERDNRQRLRAERKNVLRAVELELQLLIDITEEETPGVHAKERINHYSRLQSACDSDWNFIWGERGDFVEQELEARVDWSGLMQLGSTTSEDYLNQIQKYLARYRNGNYN